MQIFIVVLIFLLFFGQKVGGRGFRGRPLPSLEESQVHTRQR